MYVCKLASRLTNTYLLHIAVLCDSLTLSNGSILYSPDTDSPFDFNTVAIPRCDKGFALNGSVARICEGDGVNSTGIWSGEPAFCEREFSAMFNIGATAFYTLLQPLQQFFVI